MKQSLIEHQQQILEALLQQSSHIWGLAAYWTPEMREAYHQLLVNPRVGDIVVEASQLHLAQLPVPPASLIGRLLAIRSFQDGKYQEVIPEPGTQATWIVRGFDGERWEKNGADALFHRVVVLPPGKDILTEARERGVWPLKSR